MPPSGTKLDPQLRPPATDSTFRTRVTESAKCMRVTGSAGRTTPRPGQGSRVFWSRRSGGARRREDSQDRAGERGHLGIIVRVVSSTLAAIGETRLAEWDGMQEVLITLFFWPANGNWWGGTGVDVKSGVLS
ncbi:uncharacterized protein PADG_07372 [Paracoccidioides brasiliensis Pb18]|uniref:Uncharacterized protein n=1 Tax=Paracoccidioides brasiliensis (strain Pb18) TaxID=502780 RepID=C1GJD6_PARBD|nr:uncharacterized protein PADG_07372 [Paracoccidioides brasiliensis Pb18]EEH42552.1 hypothetical protein PADG_07372 [Paracoccidioides brasiliensis Pb18]